MPVFRSYRAQHLTADPCLLPGLRVLAMDTMPRTKTDRAKH